MRGADGGQDYPLCIVGRIGIQRDRGEKLI